jgi:hypothetical protein
MPIKKLFSRVMLTAGLVASLSFGVSAQGPGGPGGGRGQGGPGGGRMMMGMGGGMGGGVTGLLMMKEVREELKLDEDQVAELEDMGKAMMESMRNMRPPQGQQPDMKAMQENMEKMRKAMAESESKVEEMLDPKQVDRLIGLLIQRENLRSLNSKLVADRLGITEDQKTKMAAIEKEQGEKMRELFQGGFNADMRDKMREMREGGETKMKELLTDKQKSDMESLKGPEFKFPEPQFGRGGPGGPGGGRGGRGGQRPGGDGV